MQMLTGIHHVQLCAPADSEAAARQFYGELLGLLEIEKPRELSKRGGVWFELGDGRQVHIGAEHGFLPSRKAHTAFVVAGLAVLREKLERAGYVTESDDLFSGYYRFYTRDPFGNRIEFIEPIPISD
jgi:catechol 2,3-dioxygenase-like lactoylglutathione lyase family enzyme